MPSTSSETNFITRLPAVRLPKSLTNIVPMTTATFPNAIVPLIINTTAFLLIAATKGSRKTVMPPVTSCTLPAVTVHVRETPPSPIPEVAEARPPTTAETPVIILINPVVIPVPAKPGAHAALIPVPTAAAEHAPVVLLARLPLLPAQAARHRPPVRVLLLVPGVRAPLLQALPVHLPPAAEVRDPPAGTPVFREEALPVPENRLVRAMKNRPEVAKTAPEQHSIPARKKGQHASPAEALPVQVQHLALTVTVLLAKTVQEQPVILANQSLLTLVPAFPALRRYLVLTAAKATVRQLRAVNRFVRHLNAKPVPTLAPNGETAAVLYLLTAMEPATI